MVVVVARLVGSAVIAEISMITAIAVTAVTFDIVARQCAAVHGRYERAARTARAAAVSRRRRRTMTNLAMVAAQPKRLVGNNCKQPEEGIIRIIQIIKMMKIIT